MNGSIVPDGGQGDQTSGRDAPVRRRTVLLGALGTGGAAVTGGGWYYRATHRRPKQLCSTVVFTGDPDHDRVMITPGEEHLVVPGTRVCASTRGRQALVDAEHAWLARAPEWTRRDESGLTRTALQDLRVLTLPGGAPVAGWPPLWRYVWPRDAAFVAVALAATGYADEARAIVEFMAGVQHREGWFSARYLPDGSGVPDTRTRQLDSLGWFCWSAAEVARRLPAHKVSGAHRDWAPAVALATSYIGGSLDPVTSLPPASPDYWEVAETTLTLGTAAPLLLGLREGASFLQTARVPTAAAEARQAAARLQEATHDAFGPGYPRHLGGRRGDVSPVWLLPPFAAPTAHSDTIREALDRAVRGMRRPAGGLSPGAGWKNDGISWTPQTSLVALCDAASGDPQRRRSARDRLAWLARHRTTAGSLPEKVLHDGTPAGPAPLSWSAAVVVLAVDALENPAPA